MSEKPFGIGDGSVAGSAQVLSVAGSSPDDPPPGPPSRPPRIEDFLGEHPTRDLLAWAWLWQNDARFPIHHGGGLLARLVAFGKKLLRPLGLFPVKDLWDRQRVYNAILIEILERYREEHAAIRGDHRHYLERLDAIDARTTVGLQDVMLHNDALFSRVDQKLDRYRREARELWHRLGALVAAAEAAPPGTRPTAALDQAFGEQQYLNLEERFRGSEQEIASRIAAYAPYFEGKTSLLDLGCGRGEALELFARQGLAVHGIDSSAEMVARCREKGLSAEQGDLFGTLAAMPDGSYDAVVSFHVIEHLPPQSLPLLVRSAWRVLKPGGVLILETPSPLSVVMSARNFWADPTHLRPVHPWSLEVVFREAGFEPVTRLDLHPFPEDERLPEIALEPLPADQRPLADQINRLRDLLDDLLFGDRDFALIGIRP